MYMFLQLAKMHERGIKMQRPKKMGQTIKLYIEKNTGENLNYICTVIKLLFFFKYIKRVIL